MEFNAVDGATLLTLRIAGAIFALAGLWLVLKPHKEPAKGEEDEEPKTGTRIKAFGLEFEASSAGLLIVLIGIGLFASPLFVREKANWAGPGTGPDGDGGGFGYASPIEIEGVEGEPNNSIASANIVPAGAVVSGAVERDNEDFFKVEIPEDATGEIVFTALADYIGLTVLKDDGEVLYSKRTGTSATWRGPVGETAYYAIRLQQWNGRNPMPYQLMIVSRPE
ncbi:MAG: hypothetical protein AAFY59_13480 [Pseudomonadota bacterium]